MQNYNFDDFVRKSQDRIKIFETLPEAEREKRLERVRGIADRMHSESQVPIETWDGKEPNRIISLPR